MFRKITMGALAVALSVGTLSVAAHADDMHDRMMMKKHMMMKRHMMMKHHMMEHRMMHKKMMRHDM